MTEYDAAFQAGMAAAANAGDVRRVDDLSEPFAVIPAGHQVARVPFERAQPVRIEAKRQFGEVESLATYINLFKSPATQLFATRGSSLIYAVLDYHQPGEPSFGSHRASLKMQFSEEFSPWLAAEGRALSQLELATLLDDQIESIRVPNASEVLTAVQKFNLRRTATLKQAIDLTSNAVQIVYEESDGKAGSGPVDVPTQFVLGLPIYEGGPLYEVSVRLRYAVCESKLSFTLTILRKQIVLKAAFNTELKRAEEATGLKALHVLD